MRAIPKTAKIHPAAKKCCGWEKPAICDLVQAHDCFIHFYIIWIFSSDVLDELEEV